MLNDKEIIQIRDELKSCKKPIFFFHDDPDGLASFLLLYRYVQEGKGIVLKAFPQLKEVYARKVEEFGADKVFVLDIAMVDQEFIDAVKVPVVWIDHHPPMQRDNVKYFNSRNQDNLNTPVSYMCYQIVKQDLWIAMVGCGGDWYWPDFVEEFREKYPELLPKHITKISNALYETLLGKLITIFSFNLKGGTSEVMKSIKILTRIKTPNEILDQETPKGKFIYKKYEKIKKPYDELLAKSLKSETNESVFVFTYSEDTMSLTKDLANELLFRFPDKIIILGRDKSGEYRCSIRSRDINLLSIIPKAIIGIDGYSAGHEHACGAAIKKHDFKKFIDNIKRELNL